jgi:hypothetical protein
MSLDKHQLARLHGVLGPFMLRRVKADVVAEMVPKTEVRRAQCGVMPGVLSAMHALHHSALCRARTP